MTIRPWWLWGLGGIGVAIVALLVVIAYALLTGDGDGSEAEVVGIAQGATPTPTATPRVTPSPTPPAATPEPSPPPCPDCPEPTPCPQETACPVCPEPVICPDCPLTPDALSATCAGVKVGIELDELLLEIAKTGELVGSGGSVDPSQLEARLASSNHFFDTYCPGVDLSPSLNTLLTSSCARAGKWEGSLSADMFYAPSSLISVRLSMASRIIDQYCLVAAP